MILVSIIMNPIEGINYLKQQSKLKMVKTHVWFPIRWLKHVQMNAANTLAIACIISTRGLYLWRGSSALNHGSWKYYHHDFK